MGTYVDIGGLDTWYDEQGQGDPLVLMHGGLSTNDSWGAQMPVLAERFHVFAPERRAHGHTRDLDGPFSYDEMATHAIGFLETVVREPAHFVGWSDGGIIGLLVAIARPDLVRKLVVIGANYDANGLVPEAEAMFTEVDRDAPMFAMMRMMYAAVSPDGDDHWPVVLTRQLEMARTQPRISVEDLGRITAPTLVLVGDDDLMTLEHTISLYRAIATSELAVIPGTSHIVAMEKPDLTNRIILDFLERDPMATFMPFRRAPATAV
jgi:pimeloyl-ACP methyl ester carboxylesterase